MLNYFERCGIRVMPLNFLFLLATLTALTSACSPAIESDSKTSRVAEFKEAKKAVAEIKVSEPYFRLMPPGQAVSAGFMVVHNTSSKPVTIIGVTADGLQRVEMHEHTHSDGVMRMRKLDNVTVESGSSLAFEPGGYHLMLFGVPEGMQPNDEIRARLLLSSGAQVEITLIAHALVR